MPMTMTVMIQYFGHVVHAGGSTTYRAVTIELTADQVAKLILQEDEAYGVIALATKEQP